MKKSGKGFQKNPKKCCQKNPEKVLDEEMKL
jgi:hypothetical protein